MRNDTFVLHPQLTNDTILIGDLSLCRVLLMNDSRYPWLILVPKINDICDITEIGAAERVLLFDEISRTAEKLKENFKPDHLNIAMLGNVVPQLHCHIIARFETDHAWPKPVWGVGPAVSYQTSSLEETTQRFRGIVFR